MGAGGGASWGALALGLAVMAISVLIGGLGTKEVAALTVDQLPTCRYEANLFGQKCCMPGQTDCPADYCKCPNDWDCENNKCTAPCSSYLLYTNSGKPKSSFTYCEIRSTGRGMPNCYCPIPMTANLRAVCTKDKHSKIPRKMCTYKRIKKPKKKKKQKKKKNGRRLLEWASGEVPVDALA